MPSTLVYALYLGKLTDFDQVYDPDNPLLHEQQSLLTGYDTHPGGPQYDTSGKPMWQKKINLQITYDTATDKIYTDDVAGKTASFVSSATSWNNTAFTFSNTAIDTMMKAKSVVTFTDGTTGTIDVKVIQTAGNDTFIVADDYLPDITSKPIQYLRIESVYPNTINTMTRHEYNDRDFPVCFNKGTLIETNHGPMKVEDLKNGSLIKTTSGKYHPIFWISHTAFPKEKLEKNESLRGVFIPKNTFRPNYPSEDLVVSRHHRILIDPVDIGLSGSSFYCAAKFLLDLPGVEEFIDDVCYYHVLLDGHYTVYANDLPCESLYPGPMTMRAVSEELQEPLNNMVTWLRFNGADFTLKFDEPKGSHIKSIIRNYSQDQDFDCSVNQ